MDKAQKRRSFLKSVVLSGSGVALSPGILIAGTTDSTDPKNNTQKKAPTTARKYNSPYTANILTVLLFPLAVWGQVCLFGRKRRHIAHER
jgi:hypothetical protein